MHVLVATSSYYRQTCYREILEGLGHEATLVSGGVDCLAWLRRRAFDLLLLEAPLHWGGGDGVLDAMQQEPQLATLPIILICASQGSLEWFQLSRFRVDDFLVRVPTRDELHCAIERCAHRRPRRQFASDHASEAPAAGQPSFSRVAGALRIPTDLHSPGAASCSTSPSARC
jgi:CheY-like chemotaxis protein